MSIPDNKKTTNHAARAAKRKRKSERAEARKKKEEELRRKLAEMEQVKNTIINTHTHTNNPPLAMYMQSPSIDNTKMHDQENDSDSTSTEDQSDDDDHDGNSDAIQVSGFVKTISCATTSHNKISNFYITRQPEAIMPRKKLLLLPPTTKTTV